MMDFFRISERCVEIKNRRAFRVWAGLHIWKTPTTSDEETEGNSRQMNRVHEDRGSRYNSRISA